MAIGDFRLSTTRYVRPGTYIGFVQIPRPTATPDEVRFPCYVGRGNRLAQVFALEVIRAYVENEELSFTSVVPYQASLDYSAINDKTVAFLYKLNREVVPTDKWDFRESNPGSGVWDMVEISALEYDSNATYYIDYQSNDSDRQDDLPFNDVRQMVDVGDAEGQNKYEEFVDYRVVTELVGNSTGGDTEALVASSNNSQTSGTVSVVGGTGTVGGVDFNTANNNYVFPYNMDYTLTVQAFTLNTSATYEIEIAPASGGNDQANQVPMHSSLAGVVGQRVEFTVLSGGETNVQIDANYPFTDGIRIDVDLSIAQAPGDTYTWSAYGPGRVEIASPHFNDNQFAEVPNPTYGGNFASGVNEASSGTITINPKTAYNDTFNRDYDFRVYDAGGSTGDGPNGNRQFTILWSSYNELPYTEGQIQVNEATASTYTEVSLEKGIYVDINLGAGHDIDLQNVAELVSATDATNLTTALALAVDAKAVYDDHDSDGTYARHQGGSTGNHQTTITPVDEATLITFCQELQTLYTAHIADSNMHVPIDDIWTLDATISPTTVATCAAFLNDFKAKYNRHTKAFNFTQGDTWSMNVQAPRREFTAKDDREYTLSLGVTSATSIDVAWYTDTYEGRFGSFTVPATDIYVDLPDNVLLSFRNYPITPAIPERFAQGDQFTFTGVNRDQIDWSLEQRTSETIDNSDIQQDSLGRITGTPTAYYITMLSTPTEIIRVEDASTGALISYSHILNPDGSPTPYVMFVGSTKPANDVVVYYSYGGQEPAAGQTYYITAYRLRADSEYNKPTLYLTREDMARGLSPKTTDNHLWIAGDIAFDTDFFGAYFCQVQDSAGNQTYSIADYRNAIDSTEKIKDITDLVVVGYFGAVPYAKLSIEKMADPFVRAERMLWVGAPVGTEVGDVDTPDTLVYLAKKTLQFTGNNPGRGHVVLVGNSDCTRTLVLDDGTVTTVVLDGSFVAAYTAARNAAFTDPGQTLLRRDCASFDTMQTFTEPEQDLLGAARVMWLNEVGDALYRYEESTTVDTSSPDLEEISAMNQKIFVTRKVAKDMDANLIAIVPPSPAAGVALVQAYLADEMSTIVSSGAIAPYGSDDNPPTVRELDPGTDLYVFVDENDRRLYHFGYYYNLRYPIKRLFGLYSVDTRFWDARQ